MDAYDALPYPDALHEHTHLDFVASRARLMGVPTADPETARVLEIGSAMGANLVAMAAAFPNASFVGIDLSKNQIADAEKARQHAGLTNLRFEVADLRTIDASWGEFDYILAHGVFSWVPPDVADALLRLSDRLAKSGVMYVSYNVFPGWSDRIVLRELLMRHTASMKTPREQVAQARQLLGFLASEEPRGAWANDLERICEEFGEAEDGYLFHEWLEAHNHPVWFEDFVARAREAGLAYVTDTQIPRSVAANYGPTADALLGRLDEVGAGRYLDFLGDRRFRQSLLVRADVPVDRDVRGTRMESFRFSARFTAEGPPGPDPWDLEGRTGTFQASTPTSKAALVFLLSRAPERPTYDTIRGAVVEVLGTCDEEDLRETLLACVLRDWVGLHVWAGPMTSDPGDRPKAWALARRLASNDAVPSLLHENVRVGPLGRWFLGQLDGKRTLAQLTRGIAKLEGEGELSVQWPQGRPDSAEKRREVLADLVADRVRSLAQLGLLVRTH